MSLNQNSLKSIVGDELLQTKKAVEEFIDKGQTGALEPKKFLVVGDIGLDKYIFGSVDRISPEAPVPVLKVESFEEKLGLSANVAQNLSVLGGQCELVSVVGYDKTSEKILEHLKKAQNLSPVFYKSEKRPTTLKTRVLSGQHHLLRLDEEDNSSLTDSENAKVLSIIDELDFKNYGAVIIEDYGKGFVTPEICKAVISKSKEASVKVFVDPAKGASPKKYEGAFVFKPNKKETYAYEQLSATSTYDDLLEWIKTEGSFQYVVSTLGSEGMALFSDELRVKVPTFAKKVFDVTGAGDTVIASMAFAFAQGLSLKESAYFANLCAGVVVEKVGAVTCSFEDLKSLNI